MAKLVTTDINSEVGFTSDLNANFAAVETALENTLSRDGTSPNMMNASLDMNSNRILNLPAPVASNDPVRLIDLDGIGLIEITPGTIGSPTGLSGQVLTSDGSALATFQALPAAPLGLGTLVDPNADRILFWDDSFGGTQFLTASTGLLLSGTTLTVNMLGLQSLADPNADRIFFWDDSAALSTFLTVNVPLEISGTGLSIAASLTAIPTVDTANDLIFIKDATDSTWKTVTPAALVTATPGATVITKYKTADEAGATFNVIPVEDTHLTGISLDASGFYILEGFLRVQNDVDSGVDIRLQFSSTAAITSARASYVRQETGGTDITTTETTIGGAVDPFADVRVILDGLNGESIVITGYVEVAGSATTLGLKWAQGGSDNNLITMYKGSWLRLTKLN